MNEIMLEDHAYIQSLGTSDFFIDHEAGEIIRLVASVRLSVRPSMIA